MSAVLFDVADDDETVRKAGIACIDWAIDTGDCHLCTPNGKGRHEEFCPLRPYFDRRAAAT